MNLVTVLFCAIIIFLLCYLCVRWRYSYWARVGLDYLEPEYFYGNTRELSKKKVSMGDQFANIYRTMKAKGFKHGGFYFFINPIYMPVDLDFLKNVLQIDFAHFVNHGIYVNEEFDPLSGHLFAMEDEKWRRLRSKISHTFTAGKIKMMYQTLLACSTGLKDVLEEHARIQDAVDIKDVVARFTTDVIASIGFGLECNSLKDPNAEFRDKGRKIFELDGVQRLKETATFILNKKVLQLFNIKFLTEEVNTFFLNVVQDTIKYRETNNVYRKDFVHLLLQLKNRGKVADDEFITKRDGEEDGPDFINFNEFAAQCMFFFIAGFETSATTMSFALLELAINQEIQDKLREEFRGVLKKYDGELSYEAVMEMKYLDKVVYETLRKHPSAPIVPRVCTKNYRVPGTDVTIEKGTQVFIPILGIHHDPEIYPDPETFDPERFNEENKATRHSAAFLAFGEGPRYCLGARLGLLQIKVGLITILNNYKVNVHKKTQLPIKYVSHRFVLAVDGGVWLTVSNIE